MIWQDGISGEVPPKAKEGWDHSDMVLVFYKSCPDLENTDKWSIAYYHHVPPFGQMPHWIDFNCSRGRPLKWWPLPKEIL